MDTHPGDSAVQQKAEAVIRRGLEQHLQISLSTRSPVKDLRVDGYAEGDLPILVEIWAHQGEARGSQPAKAMKDMCKLLLLEKRLGRKCRKIFAAADDAAVSFLRGGTWQAAFAKEFGIEVTTVDIPQDVREAIHAAQKRQYR